MTKTTLGLVRDLAAKRMSIASIAAPIPRAGELLVEVHVSAVNEMDVEVRTDGWAEYVEKFLGVGPVVTGFEFAGVAQSDGERIRSGDRVVGYVHVVAGPRTHAGLIAVQESDLFVLPQPLTFRDGAALVSMGLTAIEILEGLKPVSADQSVLVLGAAGGVGAYVVQLAKHQGARVIAVCSQQNDVWVRRLGADEVRPYENTQPLQDGDAFDLVVDAPAKWSFAKCRPHLATDGMYVTTNPFMDQAGFDTAATTTQKAGHLLMLTTTPQKLSRLLDLALANVLRPAIDSVYPASEADEAFDRFATRGKQGRVLIEFQV
jgi:NADPH:quinone reductase